MTLDQYQSAMTCVETMRQLSEGEEQGYWSGYRLGLSRVYFGEQFETEETHETLLRLAYETGDPYRRARGIGYRDGFRWKSPDPSRAEAASLDNPRVRLSMAPPSEPVVHSVRSDE